MLVVAKRPTVTSCQQGPWMRIIRRQIYIFPRYHLTYDKPLPPNMYDTPSLPIMYDKPQNVTLPPPAQSALN